MARGSARSALYMYMRRDDSPRAGSLLFFDADARHGMGAEKEDAERRGIVGGGRKVAFTAEFLLCDERTERAFASADRGLSDGWRVN